MLRRSCQFGLVVLASASALVGVGAASAATHDHVVGAGASGQTIRLAPAAVLRINLPENPSTGYGWRTTGKPASSTLRLLSNRYVAAAHAPGLVGSGGTRSWRYRAQKSGRTSLVIKLFPPGSGTKAAKVFRLTVVVGGK